MADTSRLFISIGLGFQLECSLDEALTVANSRRAVVLTKVAACTARAARIRSHLDFTLLAIDQLRTSSSGKNEGGGGSAGSSKSISRAGGRTLHM